MSKVRLARLFVLIAVVVSIFVFTQVKVLTDKTKSNQVQANLNDCQWLLNQTMQIKNECLATSEQKQMQACCSALGSPYWYEDGGVVYCAYNKTCEGIGNHDCIIYDCGCTINGTFKNQCIVGG